MIENEKEKEVILYSTFVCCSFFFFQKKLNCNFSAARLEILNGIVSTLTRVYPG